jgi:acyl-CoA thioester hydrolase
MKAKERATVCDTTRESYRHWTDVTLRYGDTDRQGHINNAVYCTMFESGRCHFLFDKYGENVAGEGKSFVIAKLALDYLQEMNFPGTVEVGSRILSISRSSFSVGQGAFMNETCYSTAESVIVLIDQETKRSTPLTASLKEKLRALMT